MRLAPCRATLADFTTRHAEVDVTSIPDSAPTLLPGPTHTTRLPAHVERAALSLLASGRISDQLRAAQLLAAAYADDEERRLEGQASAAGEPAEE